MLEGKRERVRVCLCVREREREWGWVCCMNVCLCVWVREWGGDECVCACVCVSVRERKREREREREKERERERESIHKTSEETQHWTRVFIIFFDDHKLWPHIQTNQQFLPAHRSPLPYHTQSQRIIQKSLLYDGRVHAICTGSILILLSQSCQTLTSSYCAPPPPHFF